MQTDDQITPEPADGLAEAHARLAGFCKEWRARIELRQSTEEVYCLHMGNPREAVCDVRDIEAMVAALRTQPDASAREDALREADPTLDLKYLEKRACGKLHYSGDPDNSEAKEYFNLWRGALAQANRWRGIASAMGYEPRAHNDVKPRERWLTDRIKRFRAAALINHPTGGESHER